MTLTPIELICIVFITGIINYIVAYLSTKGKNKATNEDIGKITSTVEKIKSELSFALKNQIDFLDESKKSLLSYFDNFNSLIEDAARLRTEHLYSVEKIIDNKLRIQEFEVRVRIAESRLELYINDNDLKEVVHKLRESSIEYCSNVSMSLGEFSWIQKEMDMLKKLNDYENNKDRISQLYEIREQEFKKYWSFTKRYFEFRYNDYNKLVEKIKFLMLNRT